MKNIKELRNMARNIGVVSPTSKSKEKLIEEMMDIIEGRVIPEYVNSNRGRPAKNIINQEIEYNNSINNFKFSYKVASPTVKYNVDMVDNLLSGTICKEETGYYLRRLKFLKSVTDIKIDDDFVNKYKLNDGDFVEYIKNDNEIAILKVNNAEILTEIDDIDIENIQKTAKSAIFAKNKSEILYILEKLSQENKILVFSNQNIPFNGKNVLIINNFQQNKDNSINFISSLNFATSLQNSQDFDYIVFDRADEILDNLNQLEINLKNQYMAEIKSLTSAITKNKSKLVFVFKKDNKDIRQFLKLI